MVRKLAFAFISVVVLPIGVDLQALSGLGVVMVSLVLQINCAPYIDASINRMESMALATSFSTLFFGLYLFSPNTSPWFRMLSSLAVVGMNAAFLAYVAFSLRGAIKEAHAMVRLKIRKHAPSLFGGSTLGTSESGGTRTEQQSMSTEVEMVATAQPAAAMHTNRMFAARTASARATSLPTVTVADAPAPQSSNEEVATDKWTEFTSEGGAPYYHNAGTGESLWTKPGGAV